ncbi:hypothetical protein AB6A40_003914 [Gnathostoma spinigerum]|uniref:Uncharacterized protein n=1 Tax=Gnathostoma spinigerum TaxID=75299 RepID=A0ABD6ELP7_9BILA
MADDFEESSTSDSDRLVDCRDFQRAKFDIFVHEYREAAELRPGSKLHSELPADINMRKALINTKRKLMRVKFSLELFRPEDAVSQLQSSVNSLLERFQKELQYEESKEEFDVHNAPLPEYDTDDMELLFGDVSKDRCESFMTFEPTCSYKNGENLLHDAQQVISKYDELKNMKSYQI